MVATEVQHLATTDINQIKALLEAGQVERLHATPHHRPYNVATHSWNMAAMLCQLHPNPSSHLIKAVLFHDVAERYVGDMPSPGKWWISPAIGQILQKVEEEIQHLLGVSFELTERDRDWLKALDLVELFYFCCEEMAMGNSHVKSIIETCWELLNEDWVPSAVHDWIDEGWEGRTDDAFGQYGSHDVSFGGERK